MTTLTKNEIEVLAALRAEVESHFTREGVQWGTVYLDNVARNGRSDRSFSGILGSLTAKGLYADQGECFGSVPLAVEEDTAVEADVVVAHEEIVAQEEAADEWMLRNGETKVAMLRRIAAGWTGTRKEFIEKALSESINKHTAATQWQAGRK